MSLSEWFSVSTNQDKLIFFVLLILLAVPFIRPLQLPLPIEPVTIEAYEYLENVEPGGIIVIQPDYGMSAIPELGAGDIAVLRHTIKQVREKGCKFIIFARGFEAQKLVLRWLGEVDLTGLTYGEDYVDLGYIPGYEEILYGFFEDLKSVAPKDRYGTPIEDIPMLKGVEGGKDFAYMYASTWGDVRPYATQWGKRCQDAGIPLIVSSLSGGIPMAMPYYRTGTISAFLNSVIAGAGYERLINQPALGNSLVDAQSMVHLYAILLMVLVQIIYIVRPKTAPRAKDFERGRREGG